MMAPHGGSWEMNAVAKHVYVCSAYSSGMVLTGMAVADIPALLSGCTAVSMVYHVKPHESRAL
jgi:hypothetical protein